MFPLPCCATCDVVTKNRQKSGRGLRLIIPRKSRRVFCFFPFSHSSTSRRPSYIAFGLFLHRVDSRGGKHGVQMNQEAGMEVDGGGGGGEAGPASGETTTTRVRFCLSRRGCRWAEDISSGDRRQASAGDAAGVWVSETEASFSLRSGRLCPLLSRSLISSSSVSILVLPPGTTARLLVHESGWGWRLATSMCVARAALCTFTSRGSLCFRALPPKKQREKSHVLLCSVARCWVLAMGFGPSVRSLSCACYLLLTHACPAAEPNAHIVCCTPHHQRLAQPENRFFGSLGLQSRGGGDVFAFLFSRPALDLSAGLV